MYVRLDWGGDGRDSFREIFMGKWACMYGVFCFGRGQWSVGSGKRTVD